MKQKIEPNPVKNKADYDERLKAHQEKTTAMLKRVGPGEDIELYRQATAEQRELNKYVKSLKKK